MSDEIIEPTVATDDTNAPVVEETPAINPEEKTLASSAKDESKPDEGGEPSKDENKGEVPEAYDLKVAEGMELDQAMLEAFTPVFKELGITQEQAQKLTDTYAPLVEAQGESIKQASLKAYEETIEGWKSETLKELGIESKKALAYVAKVRDKFGDEQLSEILDETGVGNHPAMVRFLVKAGKAISEDAFPDGSTSGKVNPVDVLYPSMKK